MKMRVFLGSEHWIYCVHFSGHKLRDPGTWLALNVPVENIFGKGQSYLIHSLDSYRISARRGISEFCSGWLVVSEDELALGLWEKLCDWSSVMSIKFPLSRTGCSSGLHWLKDISYQIPECTPQLFRLLVRKWGGKKK